MTRIRSSKSVAVGLKFRVAEKRRLMRRAKNTSQSLADYICERVLVEAGCEEQVLRYLLEELTKVAESNRGAVADWESKAEVECGENPSAQRDRIVKEVRESLTQQEIAILAEFFKPAFDAGLWPEPSDASQREKS